MVQKNLSTLNINDECTIQSFCADSIAEGVARKLHQLGLCPECKVRCLSKMPLGGPIVFQTPTAVFSITPKVAKHVFIH